VPALLLHVWVPQHVLLHNAPYFCGLAGSIWTAAIPGAVPALFLQLAYLLLWYMLCLHSISANTLLCAPACSICVLIKHGSMYLSPALRVRQSAGTAYSACFVAALSPICHYSSCCGEIKVRMQVECPAPPALLHMFGAR
jgi:hypothetical protein